MPPIVYVLHGTDDFALSEHLAKLKSELDDPAAAGLNTTQLDGRSLSLADLRGATGAMPFLAKRRLVIVEGYVTRLTGREAGAEDGAPAPSVGRHVVKELVEVLDEVPETTALILVEPRPLPKANAVLKWAASAGDRVQVVERNVPEGPELVKWIEARAKAKGGAFRREAAQLMASAVGDDPRLAAQEILKLLTYVNFERPVEPEDVERLTPYTGEANVFAMVDALGERNGHRALEMLRRLLRDQDAAYAFAMMVRQFRYLLQARELLDAHATERDVAETLKLQPYPAGKFVSQARRYRVDDLERIYRKLLDVDIAIKTGQIDSDVALDTLVAGLTG